MTTLQQRQGIDFDRRAQLRGVNFRRLRFDDIQIKPNPIVHHDGVVVHNEGAGPLVDPEQFNTYVAAIPKPTMDKILKRKGLAGLLPNSVWYVSNDNGKNWILLRQLGDVNRISPSRYHVTLVEKGI
jgi:hypothetical protein